MVKSKKRSVKKTKKKSGKKGDSKLSVLKSAKLTKPKKEKVNLVVRIRRYFHDIRNEMKKVAWPNRQEIISSTLVVLTTVIILALIVSILDVIFQYLAKIII